MSHMAILRFDSDSRRARAFRAAIGKIVGSKYGLMTSESATLRRGDKRKVLAAELNEAQTRNITWRRSQSALSFGPGKPDRRSFR
jgi:hypothetical protein